MELGSCQGYVMQGIYLADQSLTHCSSLQFQITEIRKEAFKKTALILYSFSAWFCSGIASTIGICTQTFKHMQHTAKSGWVSLFQVLWLQ